MKLDVIKLLLVAVIFGILVSGCADKEAEWTIFVYMAADNNLSEQAVKDIIAMEQVKFSDDINIVVQLDPDQHFEDSQARRYKLLHNKSNYISSPVVEYLGEIDSGNYLNLADFVNWGIGKYKARRYALIIWSHGDGWSRGSETTSLCPDETQISVAKGDLRAAFELFTKKLDIVLIDACLMLTLEVICEIHLKASYIVGSENLVPYEGFPYGEIITNWKGSYSSEKIAKNIVNLYQQAHLPGGEQNPNNLTRKITAAAVKSKNLPILLEQLQSFVDECLNNNDYQYIATAREQSFSFHNASTEVDIKEFFTHLKLIAPERLTGRIEAILQSIDEVFIEQMSENLPENTGTGTVWFPQKREYFEGSKELYSNLIFEQKTNWSSFLDWALTK